MCKTNIKPSIKVRPEKLVSKQQTDKSRQSFGLNKKTILPNGVLNVCKQAVTKQVGKKQGTPTTKKMKSSLNFVCVAQINTLPGPSWGKMPESKQTFKWLSLSLTLVVLCLKQPKHSSKPVYSTPTALLSKVQTVVQISCVCQYHIPRSFWNWLFREINSGNEERRRW